MKAAMIAAMKSRKWDIFLFTARPSAELLLIVVVLLVQCSCWSARGEEVAMRLVQANPQKGAVSSQPLYVLSKKDLSNDDRGWYKYVEVNPDADDKFTTTFRFAYDDGDGVTPESLVIRANTQGPSFSYQRRIMDIRNFRTSKWERLGTNLNSQSWIWYEQEFVLDDNPADYMNGSNEVAVRFRSNNNYDVCNIDQLTVSIETGRDPSWWRPRSTDELTWQIQLQGRIALSSSVDVIELDLFDVPKGTIQRLKDQNTTVICYFSAGSYEGGRPDWPKYFPFITGDEYDGDNPPFLGKMDGWDERWLDVRRMDLLRPIMKSRIERAVRKGCDAVDPDNVGVFNHGDESGALITYNEQLRYNRWLASTAHRLNISVGLKNAHDQLEDLVDRFDWAVNEQCSEYDECDMYSDTFVAVDKAVFGIEYKGNPAVFCPESKALGLNTVKKRLDLRRWRQGCEDYV